MQCPTHPTKAKYASLTIAVREMLKILAREPAWKREAHPVRAYECPGCGAFHLTHLAPTFYTPKDVIEAREMLHKVA